MPRPLLAIALVSVALSAQGASHAFAESGERELRDPSAITVCVLPLGRYDRRLLAPARRGIEHLYGFTVVTLERRAMPKQAYYPPRKRYRAEKLLDWIADDDNLVDDCTIVLGFTAHDISTTKGEHVDWGILGMAIIGGRAAVMSTHRVKRRASRRTQARRTVNVVNHELGHALGAPHYDGEKGCIMNDAKGTVKTVDREHGLLCEPSRALIEEHRRIRLPVRDRFDWSAVL